MGYIFASNVLVAEGLDVVLGTVSMQSSFIFYNVASFFSLPGCPRPSRGSQVRVGNDERLQHCSQ